jgi:hypothetical protein
MTARLLSAEELAQIREADRIAQELEWFDRRVLLSHIDALQAMLDAAHAHVRQLEQALKFYASTTSYLVALKYAACGHLVDWEKTTPVLVDDGAIARAALAQSEPKSE